KAEFGTPLLEVLARPVQGVPGGVVLLVADPDGEVMADPAPGEQVGQGIARRMPFQEGPDLHRPNVGGAGTPLVEGPEKSDPTARVVLPAILAVENDADQGRSVAFDGLADAP